MIATFRKLRRQLAVLLASTRGAAAVEMALTITLLTIPVLNVIDLGYYAYQRMQVENAAQVGAQEAFSFCNTSALFAAGCTGLSAQVTSAIQSETLGTAVTQAKTGSPSEGYYCTTTSGALSLVATPPATPPSTCAGVSGASDPTAAPGGYVSVSATYSFKAAFPGVTVASLLTSPITKTTWTRVI